MMPPPELERSEMWSRRAGELLQSLTAAQQELTRQAEARAVLEEKAASAGRAAEAAQQRCALLEAERLKLEGQLEAERRRIEEEVAKRESLESRLREVQQRLHDQQQQRQPSATAGAAVVKPNVRDDAVEQADEQLAHCRAKLDEQRQVRCAQCLRTTPRFACGLSPARSGRLVASSHSSRSSSSTC